MISRLQKQLRQETPSHSHGYAVLSMLAAIIFTGWFAYHGITNYAQAQATIVTGSYTSPVISLELDSDEFVTDIVGATINETVPNDASTSYSFSFYSGTTTSTAISTMTNMSESALSGLNLDVLYSVQAYSFDVELLGTVGSQMPVVNSVELNYTTETIVVDPDPEEPDPIEQHIPNLSITFMVKVDYGDGVADTDLPFYFYFFKENAVTPVFTSNPTTTYSSTTTDQYVGGPIVIDASTYGLEAATYKAYVKTSKHLSSQAKNVVVELQNGTQATTIPVEINFDTLKVGDIGGNSLPYGSLQNRDDSIVASDWAIFEGLFGDVGDVITTLLGDFNNDGSVNVHDLWPFKSQNEGGNYQLGGGL